MCVCGVVVCVCVCVCVHAREIGGLESGRARGTMCVYAVYVCVCVWMGLWVCVSEFVRAHAVGYVHMHVLRKPWVRRSVHVPFLFGRHPLKFASLGGGGQQWVGGQEK
jgi:hypothetical protein